MPDTTPTAVAAPNEPDKLSYDAVILALRQRVADLESSSNSQSRQLNELHDALTEAGVIPDRRQ